MKQKKIRNWKLVKDGLSFMEAAKMFQERMIDGKPVDNICIRIGHRNFIWDEIYGASCFTNDAFRPAEVMSNEWKIFVPDTDEELKCEKVRQMMKDSNCSGLTYDKIDNMTAKEIWNHICNKLTDDQMYRMIKLYYSEKVFKEN